MQSIRKTITILVYEGPVSQLAKFIRISSSYSRVYGVTSM